jgi:hypothetical protein
MSDVYAVKEKLHKMRAKLYPSYLPGTEGKYIARTTNEATVTVEEICADAVKRGGYDGSHDQMVKAVRHFLKETRYQLADGFSVNLELCSVHPNIGGLFENANELHDHQKHQLDFRFHALKPLLDLRNEIEVLIEGVADTHGYIMEFTDVATGAVNDTYSTTGMFAITGYKLKVEGDSPDVGVYFEQQGGIAKLKAAHLAENTQSKIISAFPPGPPGTYKVVIKTQFTGATNKFLKEIRTIESGFTVRII